MRTDEDRIAGQLEALTTNMSDDRDLVYMMTISEWKTVIKALRGQPGGPAGSELVQALAVARKVIADPILWASDYQLLARALLATAQPEAGKDSGYRVFKDGNAWCATGPGFIDLQASKAGFGHTPLVALGELIVEEGEP